MADASPSTDTRDPLWAHAAVIALTAIIRVLLLGRFDTVTYDGTFYLGEARSLFVAGGLPGAFPLGYPTASALLHVFIPDLVRAGQVVSVLAGVVATWAIFRLARRHVSLWPALGCAVAFAVTPLWIQLSVSTMSEALYLMFLALGLLAFAVRRDLASGLLFGAAFATRPEALAVVAFLAVITFRSPRRVVKVLAGVAIVVAVHAAALSYGLGEAVLLPKSDAFGQSAGNWKLREATVDFEGKADAFEGLAAEDAGTTVTSNFAERAPRDWGLLARHASPVVLLLAILGFRRLGFHPLLGTLLFLPLFPLFTPRSEARFVLPYIPFLLVYAVVGVESLARPGWRKGAYALLAAGVIASLVWNLDALRNQADPGLREMRASALAMAGRVTDGARVADRKPYFAFYAGGEYVEIPVAPYDDTIANLSANGVEWLALHRGTIDVLRPALRPLMYSSAVLNGELRYEQVHVEGADHMVLRHRGDDPLQWTRATNSGLMPQWSPDGGTLAFRDGGAIRWLNTATGSVNELPGVGDTPDPLSWSPDGTRVAFAVTSEGGGLDVAAVTIATGDVEVLVAHAADDRAPAWLSPGEIAFTSNRDGADDIWIRDLSSGEERRVSDDGDNAFPSASPDGSKLAWVRNGTGVRVLDRATGSVTEINVPRQLGYAPAWSPDSRFVAVTGWDWGSSDIYLVKADGTNALLLTKATSREGMPCWHPDGDRITIVSDRAGSSFALWNLEGIAPYLERLETRVPLRVFDVPPAR